MCLVTVSREGRCVVEFAVAFAMLSLPRGRFASRDICDLLMILDTVKDEESDGVSRAWHISEKAWEHLSEA